MTPAEIRCAMTQIATPMHPSGVIAAERVP